jgi:hypothetical protein
VLRILRLFRIVRLVRLLQFMDELNQIVSSVFKSFRSLLWTMLLFSILIFIVGTVFTQVTFWHRMNLKNDGVEPDDGIEMWWGNLPRSCLSLYMAIMGGVDWHEILAELEKVHWGMIPVFVTYISFSLFAMMNVITGIFVESALKNAEMEKDNEFISLTMSLFGEHEDPDFAGMINLEQFESCLQAPKMQKYLLNMGIDPHDAGLMFRLLDEGHDDGKLDCEQLVNGMLRLRMGAKFMDIAVLMGVSSRLDEQIMAVTAFMAGQDSCYTGDVVSERGQSKRSKSTVDSHSPLAVQEMR